MRKIKNLKQIIYVLCSIFLVSFLANTTLTVLALIFEVNVLPLGYSINNIPTSVKIIALLKLISTIFFCLGLYHLIAMLKTKKIKEYLSSDSFYSLKKSGNYIIIAGVVQALFSFSFFVVPHKYKMYIGFDLNASLLITIIGVFFVFFSNILVKATEIKQENDLTI